MQVTVQKVSGGSGRSIASSASGEASMPPGTPNTRLIRSGGGEDALLQPAHRADDVADVEGLDLERDPARARAR